MTTRSGLGHMKRRSVLLILAALAALAACTRPRRIFDPVPGAVQVVLADSASEIQTAVERAITDEGLPVDQSDRARGIVQSAPVDVDLLKTLGSTATMTDADRIVTFRFYIRSDLGATRLFAEAVYQPTGTEVRSMERMVPEDHPARAVLARMLDKVQRHLREER